MNIPGVHFNLDIYNYVYNKDTDARQICYKQRSVCERRNISWALPECTSTIWPTHLGGRNLTSLYWSKPNEIQFLYNIFIFQDPLFVFGIIHESQESKDLEGAFQSMVIMVATAGAPSSPSISLMPWKWVLLDYLLPRPIWHGSWSLQPSQRWQGWGAAWSVPQGWGLFFHFSSGHSTALIPFPLSAFTNTKCSNSPWA